MENNKISNNLPEEKYNAFKDGNFWVALIISLLLNAQPILISFLTMSFHSTLIPGLFFAIAWVGWVIFKKGKKWSLIVGFLFALVFCIIGFVISSQIENKRMEASMEKSLEKFRQERELELQKELQGYQK